MMSLGRNTVAILAIGALSAGCASFWRRDVETCAKLDYQPSTPYDSTALPTLAGAYRLIVVSENNRDFSKSMNGPLELSVSSQNPPTLTGSATLSGDKFELPGLSSLSSRDPGRPGLIVRRNGDIDVAFDARTDSALSTMHIEQVSNGGFNGTWTATRGAGELFDDTGKIVPEPHGRFCALRRR
jgi:hypothetical protein